MARRKRTASRRKPDALDALLESSGAHSAEDLEALAGELTAGIVDWFERNPQERWEQRLGATRHPPGSPRQMISHNAAELSNREIGHSDYVDCGPVVQRIADILARPAAG